MVATVGSIAVDLVTNTATFSKGMVAASTTVDREAARMSKSLATVDRSMATLGTSVGNFNRLLSGLGLSLGVRQVADYADTWTRAEAKLITAGVATADLAAMQEKLFAIAQDSRQPFEAVAGLYGRMGIAARELGTSQADLLQVTETVTKALQLGGATAGESAAAVLQFSQAIASGVLQGDELRSLRENAPLVAQAIAEEFDTTVGKLKELGAAGEITSERVLKAVLNVGSEINTQFAALPTTIEGSMTRISNSFGKMIATIDKAGGLSNQFAREIEGITGAVDKFITEVNSTPEGAALFERTINLLFDMDLGLSKAIAKIQTTSATIEGLRASVATAEVALVKAREAAEDGLIPPEALQAAEEQVAALVEKLRQVESVLSGMQSAAEDAFNGMGGAVSGAVDEVQRLLNALALIPGMAQAANAFLSGMGEPVSPYSQPPALPQPRPNPESIAGLGVDPMADLTKAISDALAGSQQALTEAVFQASQPTSQEQMAWDAQIQAADATKRLVELAANEKSAGGTAVTQEEVAAINATTNAIYETSYETQRIEEEIRAATEATEESISSQQAAFDAIGYDTQRMGDSLAGIDPMTGELVSLAYAEISASNAIQASVDALNATTANGLAGLGDLVSGVFSGAGTTLTSSGGGQMGYGSSVEQNIQFINDRLLADMGPSLSGVVPANEVGGFYAEGGSWEFGGNQRGDQTPYTLMGNPGEVGMVFSDAQQRLINSMEAAIEQSSRGNGERPIQVVINADSRTTGERVRMAAIEGVRQGVRQADAVKGRGRG